MGYEYARIYFDMDAKMLEFLDSLDEYEKDGIWLEVDIYDDEQRAEWSIGHRYMQTDRLFLKNDSVDNAPINEDDYDGACKRMKEILMMVINNDGSSDAAGTDSKNDRK